MNRLAVMAASGLAFGGSMIGHQVGQEHFAGGTPDQVLTAEQERLQVETQITDLAADHPWEQGVLGKTMYDYTVTHSDLVMRGSLVEALHRSVPQGDHAYHVKLGNAIVPYFPKFYEAEENVLGAIEDTRYGLDEQLLASGIGAGGMLVVYGIARWVIRTSEAQSRQLATTEAAAGAGPNPDEDPDNDPDPGEEEPQPIDLTKDEVEEVEAREPVAA